MMENVPLYNSALLVTYIDLLKTKYPDVSISKLLDYARIAPHEIDDRGHWFTQEQINRFHEFLQKHTGSPQIAREAGRFVVQSKSSVLLRQYASAFVSPSVAYWMLGKISSTLSKHIAMKIDYIATNKVVVTVTPKEGVNEKKFQCENRIGLLEALAAVFTKNYSQVEHNECIHKGNDACKYIVSWQTTPSMVWKLIAGYSSLVGFVASLVLFFLLSLSSWITYTLDFVLFSTVCFLVSEILAKRDLDKAVRTQQSVGDQLMDQFTIRYNELALVKEIGEAASSILDPQLLLNFITDALQKRLQFNRGMIMLANPDKTKLVYTAGYGYNRREEELLKNTGFSLTNPNSQGIFYLVYRDMKPFLINDAAEIENRLSEKSANFMKELGIKAFICVPITYEGKPEGILAVDGTQLKNMLTQSDLSLLMGIAPQIGISLNNALAHKKLKESEERFRNLSDNSPDIIYQLNKYGTFTYTNPAWEDVLGHKISDILGKNFITFIREDDHEKFSKIFEDIIRSEATIRDQNFVMLNNHGQPRHMTFTGAPDLDAEENVIGIVGTLKDITKMRDMEAQLLQASKMEAIGTLTGGIAHDFNNIIQAIMGYNQLMMSERKGNQPGLFYLSNIEELTKRSVELVRQLLLFSRKVEPVSKIININDEINSMYNLLAKSIPRMIDIKTDLAEDIFAINADSGQIGQVIMNLIINARDAIEDSGQITIKTKNVFLQNNTPISNFNVPSGHYVELAVTDTGAGIAKDVIAHIFEPFFTTKEVGKGTGLGLSVVYGVVKSHQGFIYCESEPHQGATFTILFPAITEGKPQKQIETAPMRSSPEGTETILLVDDEKSILETSRDTLILYGYTILTAESGEQAIEIYRTEKDKINLVVLDLIMPGKGGKNCLMELMAINPQVKILMTSGYSSSQQIEDLYNAGATGFINKPYRSDDFLASIRKIIDAAH